jgi:nitrous oxidase accessory protein NosD
LGAALAFGVAAPSQADTCADPSGDDGCFTTIQAAIDAAGAGDTVKVRKGTYHETVTIPAGKDGLRLDGKKGKSIIEATIPKILGDPPNSGPGITVLSNDVRISDLTVRNAGTGANGTGIGIFVDGAAGARIDDVHVQNAQNACVRITGDGARVANSRLVSCGSNGIVIAGHAALLKKNDIAGMDNRGTEIVGNDGRIDDNRIENTGDDCIHVEGEHANISENDMESCGDTGVQVSGANPVVDDNRVLMSERDGFDIVCSPCTGGEVTDNTSINASDDDNGFDIEADAPGGIVVANNRAELSHDSGFDIRGTGVTVYGNKSVTNGGDVRESAYEIRGSGHTLIGNVAKDAVADGFEISGDGHVLKDNTAVANLQDGFDVQAGATGVVLDDNRAKRNGAMGFEVSQGATDTTLTDNKAKDNPIDFCDEGTGTITIDNDFDVTSPTCYVDF